MAKTDFCEFIATQLGTRNWVVARRTSRIIRRYGADVKAISQKRYADLRTAFETEAAN